MRVGVVGGTGTAGGAAVQELRRRGHEIVVLSRRAPAGTAGEIEHRRVDLATGDGLPEALDGLEAVVDASNAARPGRAMRAVLVEGTGRLLRAEAQAGVRQHVLISIVGIDRVPLGYYRCKLEQERRLLGAPVHAGILRSTQFHQLINQVFETTSRAGLLPAVQILLQPIDPREVAVALADRLEDGQWRETLQVGGPEILSLSELARSWRKGTARRCLLLPLPAPGRYGRALREGALTTGAQRPGGVRFADWLAKPTAEREK